MFTLSLLVFNSTSFCCAPLLRVIGSVLPLISALWVPFAVVLFLICFPLFACTKGKSMFLGLFDLHPYLRHALIAASAFTLSLAAYSTARITLLFGPERISRPAFDFDPCLLAFLRPNAPHSHALLWVLLVLSLLSLPISLTAVFVSHYMKPARSLFSMLFGVLLGILLSSLVTGLAIHTLTNPISSSLSHLRLGSIPCLGLLLSSGYSGDAASAHYFAFSAFCLTCMLYIALGVYGYCYLGKLRTVPALVSLLMALLMLSWIGSAAEFFLLRWHITVLLFLPFLAILNTFFSGADHTYKMIDRAPGSQPAPRPEVVLAAGGRTCPILVAAAGGGIQAAAWTAQVLEGLASNPKISSQFRKNLSLVTGISGGSMGSACFVNWLKRGSSVRLPSETARDSSLDEVAWGLAWPDLWRLFFPWLFSFFTIPDRAAAMERAWSGNAAKIGAPPEMNQPLSDWNKPVTQNEDATLPALIMGATIVETGGPLLLGTSDLNGLPCRVAFFTDIAQRLTGWMDGDTLHCENKNGYIQHRDVPVVRAARLSASFPYVSPVARPENAILQPHICDGGLFDNFGMASLTEWLDQGLTQLEVKPQNVLVIQIDGFPPSPPVSLTESETRGGWFKQLVAPILTLMNVRTTGQASHRDIELELLIQKWHGKVNIVPVKFDFNPDPMNPRIQPPLSWHLSYMDIQKLISYWNHGSAHPIQQVETFLQNYS